MNPTPEQVAQAEAEERAVMRQARDALQKTMAAWGGTCAWYADVKAAIAALDAYAAGVKTGDTDRQREARAREIYIRELRALLNSGIDLPQQTYDAICAAIRALGGNP